MPFDITKKRDRETFRTIKIGRRKHILWDEIVSKSD